MANQANISMTDSVSILQRLHYTSVISAIFHVNNQVNVFQDRLKMFSDIASFNIASQPTLWQPSFHSAFECGCLEQCHIVLWMWLVVSWWSIVGIFSVDQSGGPPADISTPVAMLLTWLKWHIELVKTGICKLTACYVWFARLSFKTCTIQVATCGAEKWSQSASAESCSPT